MSDIILASDFNNLAEYIRVELVSGHRHKKPWTSPGTAARGNIVTAAWWNALVKNIETSGITWDQTQGGVSIGGMILKQPTRKYVIDKADELYRTRIGIWDQH